MLSSLSRSITSKTACWRSRRNSSTYSLDARNCSSSLARLLLRLLSFQISTAATNVLVGSIIIASLVTGDDQKRGADYLRAPLFPSPSLSDGVDPAVGVDD